MFVTIFPMLACINTTTELHCTLYITVLRNATCPIINILRWRTIYSRISYVERGKQTQNNPCTEAQGEGGMGGEGMRDGLIIKPMAVVDSRMSNRQKQNHF